MQATFSTTVYEMDFKTGKLVPLEKPTEALQIGQKLLCNGAYNCASDGVISAVETFQYLGEADLRYTVINIDNGTQYYHTSREIKPIDKLFGIGTYYYPGEVYDMETVEYARARVAQMTEERRLEAIEKKRIFDESAEKLRVEFAHLTINPNSDKKIVADNIRTELKRNFPGLKFSVKKHSYSCYHVEWTDGATVEEVEKIVDKFQGGNFNGMEDIYEYRTTPFTSLFGSVQYVFTNRHISEGKYLLVAKSYGFECADMTEYNNIQYDKREAIGREVWETSFYVKPEAIESPAALTVDGLEVRRNEEKNGIEIIFSAKPDSSVIAGLKENGFRWSPFNKLWYAKASEKTTQYAESLLS